MTTRLYLDDPYLREFDTTVLTSADGWCALSRSAFYPGGGGQPADRGSLRVEDIVLEVAGVREDADGRLWHRVERALEPGTAARGVLDWPYRYALMRAHALMHVVNTVARREFDALITGVQLGPERSRIDFRLAARRREAAAALEARVNAALAEPRAIASSSVSEAEFRARPELIRTLNVRPPVGDGRVRIVTIAGFDAQACGGTHVHSTAEIGPAKLIRVDNKGRDNTRFYWALMP
ncbi:MAG TPA: alanyl-tRNA editing protein [Methylomirabilota bacterium]|nr:alanyl-tRNA editing protein [Methylomirabilota bacterium]